MRRFVLTSSLLLIVMATSVAMAKPAKEAELKVDDIVAKHLDSLGTAQVRAAAKSRVVEATAHFKILVGGAGLLDGKGVIVSEGHKEQIMMKFPNNDYRGEQFITDGQKIGITPTAARQTRSAFGEFVHTQDAMLREGLMGGVLSSAWPLLDLNDRKAKLSYEGTKTIDGHSLLDVRYKPKKGTDLTIHLYFDPETYRHVLTVYTISINPELIHSSTGDPQLAAGTPDNPAAADNSVSNEVATARQVQTRFRVEEKFSNFQTVDGLTLPTQYVIHFSQELQNGRTTLTEWDFDANQISNNVSLDPKNFQIK